MEWNNNKKCYESLNKKAELNDVQYTPFIWPEVLEICKPDNGMLDPQHQGDLTIHKFNGYAAL